MPRTEHYTLPGGIKLFFADSGGGYREFGNIIAPDLSTDFSTLPHFTARGGIRAKDREVLQEARLNLTFRFDEINQSNLNLFFFGAAASSESAGSVTISDEILQLEGTTAITTAFPMVTSSPAVVVKNLAGTVTYTEDTDYALNASASTITRLSGGSITDGQEVAVTYPWNAPAHDKFAVLNSPERSGRARLLMFPTNGTSIVWEIPSCRISAQGNLTLDQNDWLSIPMRLEILSDAANSPTEPFGSLRLWS